MLYLPNYKELPNYFHIRNLKYKTFPRLVPSLVGRASGSHYAKYATRITLFYQGKIAIIGVHKEIQMSIYQSKGDLTC